MPERFAHGYQALRDDTVTSYHVGEFYAPEAEGGFATMIQPSVWNGCCLSPSCPIRIAPCGVRRVEGMRLPTTAAR